MPTDMKWNKFLRSAVNKNQLINIIVKFIKYSMGRQLFNSPFIVTAGENIYRLSES